MIKDDFRAKALITYYLITPGLSLGLMNRVTDLGFSPEFTGIAI
jgi:hypothetical protein